jgi:hypothetical protein
MAIAVGQCVRHLLKRNILPVKHRRYRIRTLTSSDLNRLVNKVYLSK